MAVIPKRTLEDIRARCDIVDVVGSVLTLTRAGGNYRALCPFHKEKTPSFHVNAQRQIFHCFGCGVGGDVFKFMMMHESVDFMTAVKMLAQKAGITLEWDAAESGGPDKDTLLRIHSEVAGLYHKALLERSSAAHAREYLDQRALTTEIVEQFMIGYAPDRWDAVLRWSQQQKYSLEIMEATGLVLRKSEPGRPGETHYDRFRNRLMFPIRDEQARVIGFSGRALAEGDRTAKYVNSPDTLLFHKSRVLYALDCARRQMVDVREAIICEGQIDVIRCHQAGFTTAVAAQGTAFTEEHVRILRRYTDSVVLVFDPDKAGQDAAIRAASTFLQAGLAVRVGKLPAGEDPDLFIRKRGADEFRALIEAARSVVQFQVEVLSGREDTRSEVGVMRVAKAVLGTIANSPNAVQRAMLVREAAGLLGLPPTALQEDLRGVARTGRTAGGESGGEAAPPAPASRPKDLVELCEHLARVDEDPEPVRIVREHLPLDLIGDPLCRAFAESAFEAAEKGRMLQEVLNERHGPEDDMQSFAAAVQMAPAKVSSKEYSRVDAVRGLLLYIWRHWLEAERAALEKRVAGQWRREDEEERTQLTHDIKALRQWESGEAVMRLRKKAAKSVAGRMSGV